MRELDPKTAATVKDAEFLKKALSEAEVAARKCSFYAGLASDPQVRAAFAEEEKVLRRSAKVFERLHTQIMGE